MGAIIAVPAGALSETSRTKIADLETHEAGRDWQEYGGQADLTRTVGLQSLARALVSAEHAEAQAAELARLRGAEAARAAEDKARRDAEAERERQAAEERAIASRAAAEAARQVNEANDRAAAADARAKQAAIDAEKAVERARETERARIADEQAAAAEAERKRLADLKAAEDARARDAENTDAAARDLVTVFSKHCPAGLTRENESVFAHNVIDAIKAGRVSFVRFGA